MPWRAGAAAQAPREGPATRAGVLGFFGSSPRCFGRCSERRSEERICPRLWLLALRRRLRGGGTQAKQRADRQSGCWMRRQPKPQQRPHARPRLLTGITRRPEGESNPSPRPFGCPHPAVALGADTTAGLRIDARTPRPDAHARDLRLTAGLLACGSSPSVAFPGRQSQWTLTEDSPLTVAGAAAALGESARTAFPFDPQGEPSRTSYAGTHALVKLLLQKRDKTTASMAKWATPLGAISRSD